jgi:DNA-binding response OmpR family regulator
MNEAAVQTRSVRKEPSATILLVEDDLILAQLLSELLESAGHQVRHVETGAEAERLFDKVKPDLIVLDLILPDTDGLVLCTKLQQRADVPIVILSGTKRVRDAVLALKLGADDFIAKPFNTDELEARIRAVLRRAAPRRPADLALEAQEQRVGDLVIDQAHRQVSVGGKVLHLTPTEYRCLVALASHPDEVVSREELTQLVWGREDGISGRTIDVLIHRLRAKLTAGVSPSAEIISVRGVGYKMIRAQRDLMPPAA